MTVHTPIESRTRGIPGWALGVTGVMLLAGAVFYGTNLGGSNPPIGGTPEPSGGGGRSAQAIIKAAGCQSCHGPDLAGQATFPSLHGVKSGPVSETSSSWAPSIPTTGPTCGSPAPIRRWPASTASRCPPSPILRSA